MLGAKLTRRDVLKAKAASVAAAVAEITLPCPPKPATW